MWDRVLSHRYRLISVIAGTVALIGGATVLIGWFFHIEFLKRLHPGFVAMKPNTAIGISLIGVELVFLWRRKSAWPKTGIAVLIIAIGALTLAEYLFG